MWHTEWIKAALTGLVVLGTSGPAFAATTRAASTTASSKTKATVVVPTTPKDFSFSLAYGTKTDLLYPEKNSFAHRIALGVSYQAYSPWIYSLGTGVIYKSVGQDIPLKSDNPAIEDLEVSVSREFKLNENNKYGFALAWTLPTSQDAQYEQYNGIGVISNGLETRLGQYFILSNSLDLGYMAQTNEFSPTSNERNVTAFGIYNLAMAAKPIQNLSLGMWVGAKISQFTDNTWSLNQTQAGTWGLFASYKIKSLGLGLSYSNGNYEDEGPSRFLALNNYRQIVSGSISYEF